MMVVFNFSESVSVSWWRQEGLALHICSVFIHGASEASFLAAKLYYLMANPTATYTDDRHWPISLLNPPPGRSALVLPDQLLTKDTTVLDNGGIRPTGCLID